jgi:Cellulose biosynthesis protein BcsS
VPALAADDPYRSDGVRFLLFSTTDLWRHGGFMHVGTVWSPGGVDKEGFTLKVLFSGGDYQYISGALNTEVNGRLVAATILPGYRYVRGKFFATIYAGLDYQDHKLRPDDPTAGLRGNNYGLRVNAELWYEPTPSTMMTADGMVSTIDATYNARFAFGWKIMDRYYFGPEVQGFSAGDNYSDAYVMPGRSASR